MKFNYRHPQMLYHGKRIDLLSIEAKHPNGGYSKKEVVSHPGAVALLPILDGNSIVLIRNERHVVQTKLWEIPAGTLNAGEDPLDCAKRELEEETGYVASKITPLLHFFTTPGFCNEWLDVYLAEDLTLHAQKLDETEKIDVEIVPLSKAFEMIRDGTICDAKTICALLYYKSSF